MNITYRREMKRNYMIIDPEGLLWDGYESRMLMGNSVEGLLKVQIRQMESGVQFYYDITSKQPLIRMLNGQKLRAEEIRSLLMGIFGALDRMEEYLLKESRIYMDPEFIYIEPESFHVWLCFVPGLEMDFLEGFGMLLGKLLESVDHQDKDSVVLAYGIYQETRKENYGMEDIRKLLFNESGGVSGGNVRGGSDKPDRARAGKDSNSFFDESEYGKTWGGKKEYESKEYENFGHGSSGYGSPGYGYSEYGSFEYESSGGAAARYDKSEFEKSESGKKAGHGLARAKKGESNKPKQKKGGRISLWGRFCAWVRGKPPRREKQKTEYAASDSWETMFKDEEDGGSHNDISQMEVRFIEAGKRETGGKGAETSNIGHGSDTVLLADFSGFSSNRVLRALDGGNEDIPIGYYPFIIGKQNDLVDYRLDKDTVSRLHLRIDNNEGKYLIQDLNSTNGTAVRGRVLENNESEEVKIGDEILIAGYRYRFE